MFLLIATPSINEYCMNVNVNARGDELALKCGKMGVVVSLLRPQLYNVCMSVIGIQNK